MEYSDWELVREIKNGNEDAMELLVRRYYPQVFRYVLQIIESEHDAYDVTQDSPHTCSGSFCYRLHCRTPT